MSRARYTGPSVVRDRFLPPLGTIDKLPTKISSERAQIKETTLGGLDKIPSRQIPPDFYNKSDTFTEARLEEPIRCLDEQSNSLFNCPICKDKISPHSSLILQHLISCQYRINRNG